MRLTLQEASRTIKNDKSGSGDLCGFDVSGLPAAECAKIAYFNDAWRVLRWNDEWHGKPLYRAIVEKCRELDIAGATVFRGIEGYGASTLIRRAHLLSFSSDAPVMVTVVDSDEKIQLLLPFLDEMLRDGLIATSDVEVVKYVHQDGTRS